tara:strand:- start:253 stop:540 length:288 start_codon:yes stop_codon:yes gene_type:complete
VDFEDHPCIKYTSKELYLLTLKQFFFGIWFTLSFIWVCGVAAATYDGIKDIIFVADELGPLYYLFPVAMIILPPLILGVILKVIAWIVEGLNLYR